MFIPLSWPIIIGYQDVYSNITSKLFLFFFHVIDIFNANANRHYSIHTLHNRLWNCMCIRMKRWINDRSLIVWTNSRTRICVYESICQSNTLSVFVRKSAYTITKIIIAHEQFGISECVYFYGLYDQQPWYFIYM